MRPSADISTLLMGGCAAAQGTYDTVTLTFWESLPGFVSPVVALTLVELLSVLPLAAVTLTTMVTVGAVAAPLAKGARHLGGRHRTASLAGRGRLVGHGRYPKERHIMALGG
jgi:hypothetical protein